MKNKIINTIAIIFLILVVVATIIVVIFVDNSPAKKDNDTRTAIETVDKTVKAEFNKLYVGGGAIYFSEDTVSEYKSIDVKSPTLKQNVFTLSWQNPTSEWATDKDVSDYVAYTTFKNKATLKCLQGFSEPIILTSEDARGNATLTTIHFVKSNEDYGAILRAPVSDALSTLGKTKALKMVSLSDNTIMTQGKEAYRSSFVSILGNNPNIDGYANGVGTLTPTNETYSFTLEINPEFKQALITAGVATLFSSLSIEVNNPNLWFNAESLCDILDVEYSSQNVDNIVSALESINLEYQFEILSTKTTEYGTQFGHLLINVPSEIVIFS